MSEQSCSVQASISGSSTPEVATVARNDLKARVRVSIESAISCWRVRSREASHKVERPGQQLRGSMVIRLGGGVLLFLDVMLEYAKAG